MEWNYDERIFEMSHPLLTKKDIIEINEIIAAYAEVGYDLIIREKKCKRLNRTYLPPCRNLCNNRVNPINSQKSSVLNFFDHFQRGTTMDSITTMTARQCRLPGMDGTDKIL